MNSFINITPTFFLVWINIVSLLLLCLFNCASVLLPHVDHFSIFYQLTAPRTRPYTLCGEQCLQSLECFSGKFPPGLSQSKERAALGALQRGPAPMTPSGWTRTLHIVGVFGLQLEQATLGYGVRQESAKPVQSSAYCRCE